ncbi:hypothetical protein DRO61_08775 [Candidatus Bathyarchaeota archaeon]|jgi:hypothetical protein|nr:MAG: hypothetical protein DRO61_08775 [Candidatus Bathyarchaeota archaeon]
MTIRIAGHKIMCTRKRDHKAYLWRNIYDLREEIIDDVMIAVRNDKPLDEPELKRKALLIKKYSRRLRIISF